MCRQRVKWIQHQQCLRARTASQNPSHPSSSSWEGTMSRSPQDVYARHLLSSRGYPLWIPEPSHQVLLHRPDGLRIGDVGVVVPDDGGFDVFFNICLPREHPFHRATGVPDNFNHVALRDEDIRVIPNVEPPGRIISTSSVTRIKTVEPPSDTSGYVHSHCSNEAG